MKGVNDMGLWRFIKTVITIVDDTQNDENTMVLLNNTRVLQSRLNECNGLINHYELTIALLIGRLKEEQKALSSHASSDLRTQAGDSLGQSKQK